MATAPGVSNRRSTDSIRAGLSDSRQRIRRRGDADGGARRGLSAPRRDPRLPQRSSVSKRRPAACGSTSGSERVEADAVVVAAGSWSGGIPMSPATAAAGSARSRADHAASLCESAGHASRVGIGGLSGALDGRQHAGRCHGRGRWVRRARDGRRRASAARGGNRLLLPARTAATSSRRRAGLRPATRRRVADHRPFIDNARRVLRHRPLSKRRAAGASDGIARRRPRAGRSRAARNSTLVRPDRFGL